MEIKVRKKIKNSYLSSNKLKETWSRQHCKLSALICITTEASMVVCYDRL